MSSARFQLLGMSGSLRRNSSCTAVLQTVADRLPGGAKMMIAQFDQLPLYNEDEDRDQVLRPVIEFKSAIEKADGLVVISPEYNHGMSGVLKNAIDWVSRPGYDSVLKNKPVVVMTASNSALGGVRAQLQLRETFASTLSRVLARRQVVIGQAPKKIVDGKLADTETLAFIDDAIRDLLDEITLLRQMARETPIGSLLRGRQELPIAAKS
jgi:chromate reductase, NAD(P)H dehydrogenase (quinone)